MDYRKSCKIFYINGDSRHWEELNVGQNTRHESVELFAIFEPLGGLEGPVVEGLETLQPGSAPQLEVRGGGNIKYLERHSSYHQQGREGDVYCHVAPRTLSLLLSTRRLSLSGRPRYFSLAVTSLISLLSGRRDSVTKQRTQNRDK